MKLAKSVRILLWGSGFLMAAAIALYLARWPLMGGLIRSKISRLAEEHLKAQFQATRLDGTLVTSLRAREVVLLPGPGSPLRSTDIHEIRVNYGLFGSREPFIQVDGARIQLAPTKGASPPVHETLRGVVGLLRSARLPATVEARNVELTTADGKRIWIDQARLNPDSWNLSGQVEGWGTVEATATFGRDGAFAIEAKSTEGPVHAAQVEWGPGEGRSEFRISTDFQQHPVSVTGSADFVERRLSRIRGNLVSDVGRAAIQADFASGRAEVEGAGLLRVSSPFEGDVWVALDAGGPLSGPLEDWKVREGSLSARRPALVLDSASGRTLRFEEAELTLRPGSISGLPFEARAFRDGGFACAEGVLRWAGKIDLEARVEVWLAEVSPYLSLLDEPTETKVSSLHADGRIAYHESALSCDGWVTMGAGEWKQIAWEEVRVEGSYRSGRSELREGLVSLAGVPPIKASGKVDGTTYSLRLATAGDQAEVVGHFDRGAGTLDGLLRMEGAFAWFKSAFGVALPESIVPLRADGTLKGVGADTQVKLEVSGGAHFSTGLSAVLRHTGNDWTVSVAPGRIAMDERRVSYDAFKLTLAPGKAEVENLALRCSEPDLATRVYASAAWDEMHAGVGIRLLDLRLGDAPYEPLEADVTVDRRTSEGRVDLGWGVDAGDHLRVAGTWGREWDVSVDLRATNALQSALRRLLPGSGIRGSIELDAKVIGALRDPRLEGAVRLKEISLGNELPVSLVLPIEASGTLLQLRRVQERTPYGELTLEGRCSAGEQGAQVCARIAIETDDLSPVLDLLPASVRPWLPRGRLTATVGVEGPLSKPEVTGAAEFAADRFRPPAPLAEAADLRVQARLDQDGLAVEAISGQLGQGPFRVSGRWDVLRPNLPLSLAVTGRDVLVVDDPLARLRVTPDVVLTWEEGRPLKLAGHVDIPLLIFHREVSATAPGSRPVRSVEAPRLHLIPGEAGGYLVPGIEGLEMVQIDLQFATTGEARVENGVVGVLLHAEGELTGTATNPVLSGRIRSEERRGEIKLARGNFMRIESLEIVVPRKVGHLPSVRFNGKVGAGEGAIEVNVDGPLEHPQLILKSDPPQPQKDLLARLAFGLGTGAVSGETGIATVAVLLYSQTQDQWPSATRREGFFDRFRPSVVPGETNQQRPPWELPPQANLQSTSLRTEYEINSVFSIVAETNREGDVAGDLRVKIRF